MSVTASQDLADRFPTSFEEFRDAWAAEDKRKGLAAAMHRAIMRLLNALVTLLAEARSDRAEVTAEVAASGASAACEGVVEPEVCETNSGCEGSENRARSQTTSQDINDDEESIQEGKPAPSGAERAFEEKPAGAASTIRGAQPDAENASAAGGMDFPLRPRFWIPAFAGMTKKIRSYPRGGKPSAAGKTGNSRFGSAMPSFSKIGVRRLGVFLRPIRC